MAHFWGQNDVISQNLGKVVKKYFLQKFGKNFRGGSPDRNLTKNVIKGVNLAKIGHFWWKLVKMAHFWVQNDVISQNLGKVVKKNFLQKFGNIIPGGSPWKNLTKKVIKGVNLAKIGHFLWKLVKMPHFWGQNDVISQNLGKVVKKNFLQKFGKFFPGGHHGWIWLKMSLKGSYLPNYAFVGVFPIFLS